MRNSLRIIYLAASLASVTIAAGLATHRLGELRAWISFQRATETNGAAGDQLEKWVQEISQTAAT